MGPSALIDPISGLHPRKIVNNGLKNYVTAITLPINQKKKKKKQQQQLKLAPLLIEEN